VKTHTLEYPTDLANFPLGMDDEQRYLRPSNRKRCCNWIYRKTSVFTCDVVYMPVYDL
jgi:hypothetical protein